MRWGIEHLNIDEKRLKELGATGLMPPIKVSCMDHEGSGLVKFQQWDGAKWKVDHRLDGARPQAGAREGRGRRRAVREGEEHHAARLRQGIDVTRPEHETADSHPPFVFMPWPRKRSSRSRTSRSSTTT